MKALLKFEYIDSMRDTMRELIENGFKVTMWKEVYQLENQKRKDKRYLLLMEKDDEEIEK